ncbi:MAG: glycine zipper family protein [Pseudomonadota bacterium]|nr:glycine zipper family protein [Pseudomonadota bacterium]
MSEHRDASKSAQHGSHGGRGRPQARAGVERDGHHLALGMSIGVAMGSGFGALFGQIALGMGVGLCIGTAIGLMLDAKARK